MWEGDCRKGYNSESSNGTHCFKTMNKMGGTAARIECEKDNGDLATFSNEIEKTHFLTKKYANYRFGYLRRQNSQSK